MRDWIEQQMASAAELLEVVRSDPELIGAVETICRSVVACIEGGGKALTLGNGGSAAEALHLAEELVGRYRSDRPPLPAISLAADPTVLTCIANDFGYEEVFARQVRVLAAKGDVVVAFSTSGRSDNVIRALEAARERGCITIGLLGGDGGPAGALCDHAFIVPDRDSARVQEIHTLALHLVCEAIERWVVGRD